jgi:hypothetical protein
MTKEEFQRHIAHYTGPNSGLVLACERNKAYAADFRQHDPKLADMIEEANEKWFDLYRYMKERSG